MRIIAVLVLVFGVALSGGALFFASEYFESMKASMAQKGPETVRVLVAKKALNYGKVIKPTDLQWVEWPEAAVPPGAFTSAEALLGEKGDQRRIVLRAIDPGEPVLESKITKFGESPRMSMNLGKGRRAVSISVDVVSSVSGFVAPGDRVDILLTRKLEGKLVSSVILQDITIIAVDQRSNSEAMSPRVGRTVTVEVDTVQAQKLALAQRIGSLSLTLRGIGETTDGDLEPVTADSLSDFVQDQDPALKVRVRRGGSLSAVEIGEDGSISGESGGDPTAEKPAEEAGSEN
jgi:pilus assembly protein CpaB